MHRYTDEEKLGWLVDCVERAPGMSVPDWCASDITAPSSASLYHWAVDFFGKSLPYVTAEEVEQAEAGLAADTNGHSNVEAEAQAVLGEDSEDGMLALAFEAIKRRDRIIRDLLDELAGGS